MKKFGIFLIIILIIVFLFVGIFFIWQSQQQQPIIVETSGDYELTSKSLADATDVVPISIKENAIGVNRIIDVTYPSIQSFTNKNFQKYINDQITKVIFAYRNEINAVVDDETDVTALYTYKSSYEKYTHGDYLSLVISNEYQTGGIRSNKWKDIYNINCKTERLLNLSDVFAANVDYKNEILAEINKQAKENNYIIMNGAGLNDLNDNQKFYIKDEKLIIYFDPSEIAPASYGELQFEMPFELENGYFR